ncbi:SAM-dependent methyltransferase [Candidatus Micrarchaeota archaeon]|jgi:SAM-dependent methyltransferase|nr:SAM-dependent methyltransferase [Candidatus Micrarchaeota archaeon]
MYGFLADLQNINWTYPIVGALLFVVWTGWTHFVGAIWAQAPLKIIKQMLDVAKVNEKDVVYDLGCGEGRIIIMAGKRGAKGIGYEIDPIRVLIAKSFAFASNIFFWVTKNPGRTEIKWKNIFDKKIDFKKATVVTVFLMQKTNNMLEERLRKELPEGARVVSYVWKFNNWKPSFEDKKNQVYMYVV